MNNEEILLLVKPLLQGSAPEGFVLGDEDISCGEIYWKNGELLQSASYLFQLNFGYSKIALICQELPFVIKIPISYNIHWEDKAQEISTDMRSIDNTIEQEIALWKKMSIALRNIFLENKKIGEINNIPIYIQQKTLPIKQKEYPECLQNNIQAEIYKILLKAKTDIQYFPLAYGAICKYYGVECLKEALNLHITDLHYGNLGIVDGKVKFFDYETLATYPEL